MKKDELKSTLENNVMVVQFVKLNGEERTMQCTLKPDLLPVPIEREGKKQKPVATEDVLRVWDLGKSAWRSFLISNVISAKIQGDL